MEPDYSVLYRILRQRAARAEPITYGGLSRLYEASTGNKIDAHYGWTPPLMELLNWCARKRLPPLSALVISENTGIPGAGFWGQGDTPQEASLEAWIAICQQIQQAAWPIDME